MADLGMDSLGIGSMAVPGISFSKILSGGILAYFSYIWPWDYAAAAIMGRPYTVLNLNGDKTNYQTVGAHYDGKGEVNRDSNLS